MENQQTNQDRLDQLRCTAKRILEEVSTKKSIPENNCLVIEFCGRIETCLRYGLQNTFYREISTWDLLHRLSPKCPEAAKVLKLVEKLENSRLSRRRGTSRSLERSQALSPSIFRKWGSHVPRETRSIWIHVALTEKLLTPIVEALCSSAKAWYGPEAIVRSGSDTEIFLSLIAGPCALNYTAATVEDDSSWSALHADELLERYRFISLSTKTNGGMSTLQSQKEIHLPLNKSSKTTNQRSTLGGQRIPGGTRSQSSVSSVSSSNSGGMDSLYNPRKHQLLYAKNNVGFGGQTHRTGYLAVYSNQKGINVRWTSNELLLQASIQSFPFNSDRGSSLGSHVIDVSNAEEIAKCSEKNTAEKNESEEKEKEEHQTTVTRPELHSPTQCMVLNIPMGEVDCIHCHQDASGCFNLVFIRNDGIQYPTLRFPGCKKVSLDFVAALEQGLKPFAKMDPSFTAADNGGLSPIQDQAPLGTQAQALLRKLVSHHSAELADTTQENPFRKLIHYCSLRSVLSNSGNTSSVNGIKVPLQPSPDDSVNNDDNNGIQSLSEKSSEMPPEAQEDEKKKDSEWTGGEGEQMIELIFRISHLSKSSNPSEIRIPSSSHSADSPISPLPISDTHETISDALGAIKKKLLANVFYTWLRNCRYMKLVRTHLTDLVIIPPSCLVEPETSLQGLTAEIWKESFISLSEAERLKFSPMEIYQRIYLGGCDPSIRLEVWPYLLGLYRWSMTEEQKSRLMTEVRETYLRKRAEWMSLESSLCEEERLQSTTSSPITPNFTPSEVRSPSTYEDHMDGYINGDHTRRQFRQVLDMVQKDVVRCDRNNHLFSNTDDGGKINLAMLRRVLLTHIWENLDDGYTQGMCDIIAPILAMVMNNAIIDESVEITIYAFYRSFLAMQLGKLFTLTEGSVQMDKNFSDLKALFHVIDPELIEHIQHFGDFTNFYFCYRWFLLEFKREFNYFDTLRLWETILAARHQVSTRFELFIALALIYFYRDVIIYLHMEFTDILKFFNGNSILFSFEYTI